MIFGIETMTVKSDSIRECRFQESTSNCRINYFLEILFLDWLIEIKKDKSLTKNRKTCLKITKPYVVTHSCVVELIFKMCKDLNQPADTRYRTVELFDRLAFIGSCSQSG